MRKGLVADSPVLVTGTALRLLENQQCLDQLSPRQGRVTTGKPERDSAVQEKPAVKDVAVKHVKRVVVEDTEIMHEKGEVCLREIMTVFANSVVVSYHGGRGSRGGRECRLEVVVGDTSLCEGKAWILIRKRFILKLPCLQSLSSN